MKFSYINEAFTDKFTSNTAPSIRGGGNELCVIFDITNIPSRSKDDRVKAIYEKVRDFTNVITYYIYGAAGVPMSRPPFAIFNIRCKDVHSEDIVSSAEGCRMLGFGDNNTKRGDVAYAQRKCAVVFYVGKTDNVMPSGRFIKVITQLSRNITEHIMFLNDDKGKPFLEHIYVTTPESIDRCIQHAVSKNADYSVMQNIYDDKSKLSIASETIKTMTQNTKSTPSYVMTTIRKIQSSLTGTVNNTIINSVFGIDKIPDCIRNIGSSILNESFCIFDIADDGTFVISANRNTSAVLMCDDNRIKKAKAALKRIESNKYKVRFNYSNVKIVLDAIYLEKYPELINYYLSHADEDAMTIIIDTFSLANSQNNIIIDLTKFKNIENLTCYQSPKIDKIIISTNCKVKKTEVPLNIKIERK